MDKEEIIENYIRYMKIATRLDDEDLKRTINEMIEESPELLEKIEALLCEKERITSSEKEKNEKNETDTVIDIFSDINEALPLENVISELKELGYSNTGAAILRTLQDGYLYMDDIESDGTVYIALTEKGETLWELINF